jgi:aryl-alcohol dehydrogenase-like predicted oxidoreductase
LDTAPAYGDIECRIRGLINELPFDVISKIPAIPKEFSHQDAAQTALHSARSSRKKIGPSLRGLLFHRSTDFLGARGEAIERVLGPWAKEEGVSLGVSCYAPEELSSVRAERAVLIAQMPGNSLDQRLPLSSLKQFSGIELHLRSVFLQGLLLMPLELASRRVPAAAQALERWHAKCRALRLSPLQLALGVVKSFALLDTVILGVDSLEQWNEIFLAWSQVASIPAADLACHDKLVVDPRLWPVFSP